LHDDTVDGNGHTILNVNDITNVEVVVVDNFDVSLAEDRADVLLLGLCAGLDELDLFLPVDKGADAGYEHHSDHNSSALNPCVFSFIGAGEDHVEYNRKDRGEDEDLKHEVV